MILNIKKIRESKNWSIRKLSILSGVSSGYISELERGIKLDPSLSVICKISKTLNVSLNDIVPEKYWK